MLIKVDPLPHTRRISRWADEYILYRLYLTQIFPEAVLYMAVSDAIYQSFFLKSAIQFAVTEVDIKIIVFDVGRSMAPIN
jgi:hypothetical protein